MLVIWTFLTICWMVEDAEGRSELAFTRYSKRERVRVSEREASRE